jgi:hypothetical protein
MGPAASERSSRGALLGPRPLLGNSLRVAVTIPVGPVARQLRHLRQRVSREAARPITPCRLRARIGRFGLRPFGRAQPIRPWDPFLAPIARPTAVGFLP